MSERDFAKLDFRSGRVTVTHDEMPPGTFEERATALVEAAEAQLGAEGAHLSTLKALCDGCGRLVSLDTRDPKLPEGWVADPERGELCPDCQAPGRADSLPGGFPG